jgi:hypothetical protein
MQDDPNRGRSTHEKKGLPAHKFKSRTWNLQALPQPLEARLRELFCCTAIASPSIPVLLLAVNVISSNTRANVSFFSSNEGDLASSSGGGGGDRDEADPAQRLYLQCCCKSVHIMG